MNRHDRVRVDYDGLPWPYDSVWPHGRKGALLEVFGERCLVCIDAEANRVSTSNNVWVNARHLEVLNERQNGNQPARR